MFNSVDNNAEVNIENPIPFEDKFPKFLMYVHKVELAEVWDDIFWLSKTHKKITLNDGEFVGVIHNGISGLIRSTDFYTIYFDHSDNNFDRYVEILNAQKKV